MPTDYQKFIALAMYSRWDDSKKRRETWEETVERWYNFWVKRINKIAAETPLDATATKNLQDKLVEAKDYVLRQEVMPSMRSLMAAGKALETHSLSGFNCSYISINSPKSFDELLYSSMCSVGVGYSVESKYTSQLPEIPTLYPTDTTIVVADSKIGWASSLRELTTLLYVGKIPKWDLSKLRPAGARLKTMGGRSSGSGPLNEVFEFVVKTFKNAQGRKLKPIECHDICCIIGQAVVVGGVRRAALLSMSDLDDDEMQHAKHGRWYDDFPYRGLANNSAAYYKRPNVAEFMHEWTSLYRSKSGERGIINVEGLRKTAPERREKSKLAGMNPCVVGETLLLTEFGYFKIKDLVGKDVNVWNGTNWSSVTPFSTGTNEVYDVKFSDGAAMSVTPYHRFPVKSGYSSPCRMTELIDMNIGDKLEKFPMPVCGDVTLSDDESYRKSAYSQGFYAGDGNDGYENSWLYGEKYYKCQDRLVGRIGKYNEDYGRGNWNHGPMFDKRYVPVNEPISYQIEWLAGLLDSDGVMTSDLHGNGLQVVSINNQFLLDTRLMLSRMGIRSKIIFACSEEMRPMPDGKGGSKLYLCQAANRLLIGNAESFCLWELGLRTSRLGLSGRSPQRSAGQFVKIASIEKTGRAEETFCVTEKEFGLVTFNGIVTGNCGEVLLRDRETCNLSAVICRPTDTAIDILEKVEIASFIGTLQSTLTDFKYLSKKWKENCDEERLLGVSLSGIMDNPLLHNVSNLNPDLPTLLETLKREAVETNEHYADMLKINHSAAVTCVKPDGNTSQLVDSSPGIHPRFSKYYMRTVRRDKKDPLSILLKQQGVYHEDDVSRPKDTDVLYFPVKSPEGSVFRKDVTAIQQLDLWLIYKQHWCEHNPSTTIYVREDEWMEVGAWVYRNWDYVGGLSFLPYSDHIYKQAPYQEISKEEYDAAVAAFPKIDFSKLSDVELDDGTTGSKELACSGGMCEL
jgi:ribonucleotide reductase alpha subunit